MREQGNLFQNASLLQLILFFKTEKVCFGLGQLQIHSFMMAKHFHFSPIMASLSKLSIALSKTEKVIYGSVALVMMAIHLLISLTVQFFVSTKIEMAIFGQLRQLALQKRIGYFLVIRLSHWTTRSPL